MGRRACANIMSKSSRKCQALGGIRSVIAHALRQHRRDHGTRCAVRSRRRGGHAASRHTGRAEPRLRRSSARSLPLPRGPTPVRTRVAQHPTGHEEPGTRSTLDTVSTGSRPLTRRAVPGLTRGSVPSSSRLRDRGPLASPNDGDCAGDGSASASRSDSRVPSYGPGE